MFYRKQNEVNAYIPIIENKTCKSFVSDDATEHGDCVPLCTDEKDLYQKKRVGLSLT